MTDTQSEARKVSDTLSLLMDDIEAVVMANHPNPVHLNHFGDMLDGAMHGHGLDTALMLSIVLSLAIKSKNLKLEKPFLRLRDEPTKERILQAKLRIISVKLQGLYREVDEIEKATGLEFQVTTDMRALVLNIEELAKGLTR